MGIEGKGFRPAFSLNSPSGKALVGDPGAGKGFLAKATGEVGADMVLSRMPLQLGVTQGKILRPMLLQGHHKFVPLLQKLAWFYCVLYQL